MEGQAPKHYQADMVVVSFAGIPIKGFADGEFITITPVAATFEDVVGTDGEVSRFKVGDPRWDIELSVMQTATVNAILTALHEKGKLLPGSSVGTFMVKDLLGETLFRHDHTWISQPPPLALGRTVGPRPWKFRSTGGKSFHGGNTQAG